MLVAEGMEAANRRLAVSLDGSPSREAGGWGALSLLPDVVELATIEHSVQADPLRGRLNFHVSQSEKVNCV